MKAPILRTLSITVCLFLTVFIWVAPLLAADMNAEITVKGSFRYQACTAEVCFPPQDVPLEWKFQMETFDRERMPEPMRRK